MDPSRQRRRSGRQLSGMQRPVGVAIFAGLFAMAAIYLWTIAVVRLLAPGAISLMAGSQFMYGLELAGPYMALLVGAGYALVAWGLFRLHNWALTIGIASLVPAISAAELGWRMLWYGLQIALRAAAAWYLAQAPVVVDAFARKS